MRKTDILPTFTRAYMSKRIVLAGALIILFSLAVSFSIRKSDFIEVTGAQNLEATYHALLTIRALKESPIENHWFLPTVSLGHNRDKNIPWGATVPTETGDYIYTSFTPPGFLAPYIVFSLFNIEPSQRNISYFNFTIGGIVSLFLYLFLVKILEQSGYSRKITVGGAILGTFISIFSKEAMQSHGVVYWIHSFYQILFILQLILLLSYLNVASYRGTNKNRNSAYLVVSVFLGAWTEWTGYVFGVGLAILFWFGVLVDRPQRELAIKLTIAVAAAGLITLIHYGLAVGFEPAVKAFIGRFFARSTASGTFRGLRNGYALSFGLFRIVTFVAVVLSFSLARRSVGESHVAKKRVTFFLLAAAIPLLENFIMLQHAGQFSFDRLKFIFPAAIMMSVAFARLSGIWRILFAISILFASIQGYLSYRSDLTRYGAWPEVDFGNKLLANSVNKSINTECSVLLSNIGVRGYANLLFNRGIYEDKRRDDSIGLIQSTHACSAVYLEGEWSFIDLPHYKNAIITETDGTIFSLTPLEIDKISPDYFLTESYQLDGAAINRATFFVPNTDKLRAQLVIGSEIIFQNGEVRKILDVQHSGLYLYVHMDGSPLSFTHIGPPTTYILRSPRWLRKTEQAR